MSRLGVVVLCGCAVLLCVGTALSNGQNDGGEGLQITVAPNTIVLGSEVGAITVHTNLPLVTVVASTVRLNGVVPIGVWADDRGHLVARFAVAALPGVKPPEVTLTLSGELVSGDTFAASDTVRVVQRKK